MLNEELKEHKYTVGDIPPGMGFSCSTYVMCIRLAKNEDGYTAMNTRTGELFRFDEDAPVIPRPMAKIVF